ncbi:hypothetical protein B0H14DRAFT_2866758 [Mycena olivaceomarginata]|nr:hypothetical protein B0H14DRAFT_2866758 [Mycena olivaceomarginata]
MLTTLATVRQPEEAQQFRGSLETTWLDPQNFIYWMDVAIDWQPRLGERTVRRHALFYSGYAFLGKKKSKRQSRSSVVPLPICDTYRINDRRDRSVLFFCSLTFTSSVTAALDLPKPTSRLAMLQGTTKCVNIFHLEAKTAFPKTQELLLDCAKALESNLGVLSSMIVLLKISSQHTRIDQYRNLMSGKTDPLNLPHPPDLEPVRAQLRLLPAVRLVDGLSCDDVRL